MSEQQFSFSRELSPAERAAVCRALVGGGKSSLADVVGEVLEVSLGLVHQVEEVNEKGEVVASTRLALVAKDGESVGSTSRSAVDCWKKIEATFGLPPYDPPLRIKVVAVPTKKGRKAIVLHPL